MTDASYDGSFTPGTYPYSSDYRVVVSEDWDTDEGYIVTLERRETYTNDRTGLKREIWDEVGSIGTELSHEYTARDVIKENEWWTQ